MRFSMPSKLRKLITSSFFPAKILAKAIRKNGDISDLFVKDTEFKISKYADDTTLIVNGSENFGMLSAKPQASGTTIKKLKLFGLDLLLENLGHFPFNENFRKFGNSGKLYRNFQERFPEIPETVEFPKCEPFNRKFWKFEEQS